MPAGVAAQLGTATLLRWQKSALPGSTRCVDACPSPRPGRCHLICCSQLQSWHLSPLTCFSLSPGHQETAPGEEHAAGKPSSASQRVADGAGLDGGSAPGPLCCTALILGLALPVLSVWGIGVIGELGGKPGRCSRMMAQSHGAIFPGEVVTSRCGVGKWRGRTRPRCIPGLRRVLGPQDRRCCPSSAGPGRGRDCLPLCVCVWCVQRGLNLSWGLWALP